MAISCEFNNYCIPFQNLVIILGGSRRLSFILSQCTNQVLPAIASAMAGMEKGVISSPIQIQGGLVIIRVLDSRSAKIASFEASNPQLKQAIIQQYLNQSLKRLSKSAKIVR